LARAEGLRVHQSDCAAGVISDFGTLRGASFEPSNVQPSVARFYEQTSAYELDAWAEWCGLFRPFGWLLAVIFSRRLQQLNVPLSGLDTSKGVTNEVHQFIEPATGATRLTAWFRRLRGTGNVRTRAFTQFAASPAVPTRA
jgi:hypothetical protein